MSWQSRLGHSSHSPVFVGGRGRGRGRGGGGEDFNSVMVGGEEDSNSLIAEEQRRYVNVTCKSLTSHTTNKYIE